MAPTRENLAPSFEVLPFRYVKPGEVAEFQALGA